MILNTLSKDLAVSEVIRKKRYVPALTGLRAIAAYLVFLHHYNPASPGTFAYRLFFQGYVGVSLFFVLSGFLIYYRYADTYFEQKYWSWRSYLQNRFVRIFPLYALLLVITVGAGSVMGRPMSLPLSGLNVTLLKGFSDETKFSGIAQSWSLTVEGCFYLLAPPLFIGLRRWGLFWLTVGLVSIGILLWGTVGQMAWHGVFSSLPFVFFYTFFGRAFEFTAGMWLAYRWHRTQFLKYRFATLAGLLIACGCVLWQANVVIFTANPTALLWSEVVVYNYLLPITISLLFMGLNDRKSIFRYVLSRPLFQAFGQSSYAFYLIHIGVVASGLQKLGVTNTWMLFCLLILMAHSLYIFVEKPLQQCLKKL